MAFKYDGKKNSGTICITLNCKVKFAWLFQKYYLSDILSLGTNVQQIKITSNQDINIEKQNENLVIFITYFKNHTNGFHLI